MQAQQSGGRRVCQGLFAIFKRFAGAKNADSRALERCKSSPGSHWAARPVCGLRLVAQPELRAFAPHGQIANKPSALAVHAAGAARLAAGGLQAGKGVAGVGVGDGQAERVGGVLPGGGGQGEQAAHHFLHLRFGRAAVACHGLLHLQGGVFGDGQVLRDQRRHAGAARLAEQQGGLGIDVDEDDFDHGHVWGVAAADFAYAVIQELEPRGQAALWRVCGLDDAAGHVGELASGCIQHAEAGGAQAGVDAEDSHGELWRKAAGALHGQEQI